MQAFITLKIKKDLLILTPTPTPTPTPHFKNISC